MEVPRNFYRLIFGKFIFGHIIGEKKFRHQTSEMREDSLISCTKASKVCKVLICFAASYVVVCRKR